MARSNYTGVDAWLTMPLGRFARFLKAHNELEEDLARQRKQKQRAKRR